MAKIEYSMQTKALPGESVSGDITWIKEFNNQLLLCLIDVSGHGKLANILAQACIPVLEANYQKNLNDIILIFDNFLKDKTRGLVLGIASIDIATGLIKYIGIGNIRTRILGHQSYRFVSRPGILGFSKTRPILEKYMLNDKDILLMYSDGISDHFEKNSLPEIETTPVDKISDQIMSVLSKNTDDSSCIVARYTYD